MIIEISYSKWDKAKTEYRKKHLWPRAPLSGSDRGKIASHIYFNREKYGVPEFYTLMVKLKSGALMQVHRRL